MREDLISLHKQLIRLQAMTRDLTLKVERILRDCKEPQTEPDPPAGEFMRIVERVIGHLNEKANKRFSTENLNTRALIRERLAEGYTEEDLKAVVTVIVHQWSHEPEMMMYIRPETLFGRHFESYLQAARGQARPSDLAMMEKRMIERMLKQ